MVVVLVHHLAQVRLPPLVVQIRVIVFSLVNVPAVHELIHHQHSQAVAGLQHGLGDRIVGGADCVVAVLHEDPDAALFRLGIGAGAQNAVVVVNAGAAQDDALAVDEQALSGLPFQGPDSESLFHHIFAECDAAGVKVGSLGAPELTVLYFEVELGNGAGAGLLALFFIGADEALLIGAALKIRLLSLQDLDPHLARHGCIYGHADPAGLMIQCADPDAVYRNIGVSPFPEPYRPVDAGAGIPAAVGLVGIARLDQDLVLLTVFEKCGGVYIEVGIAVRSLPCFFAVDINFRVVIDALELEDLGLPLVLCRDL